MSQQVIIKMRDGLTQLQEPNNTFWFIKPRYKTLFLTCHANNEGFWFLLSRIIIFPIHESVTVNTNEKTDSKYFWMGGSTT